MNVSETTKPVEVLLVEASHKRDASNLKRTGGNANLNNLHRVSNHKEVIAFLHQEAPFQTAPLPDIIVIDSNLRSPDAFQLLSQIKKDEVGRRISVVVCSPSEFFHSFHSYCYITQPVSVHEGHSLVQFIKNCCASRKFFSVEEKGRNQH